MRLIVSCRGGWRAAALCASFAIWPWAAGAQDQTVTFANQGADWNPALRAEFYSQDQGSRIMPLSWLKALKQPDGQAFLADALGRYGYLPNPASSERLPVGFSGGDLQGEKFVGMTCAACHTRQISVEGQTYRIDGGPAIVDTQSFFAGLNSAVAAVLADDHAFGEFADAVLGPEAPLGDRRAALRVALSDWRLRYDLWLSALPGPAWGYGRLDAVSMIFNRVTGLDIGASPNRLIKENILKADAPARPPFLWNAPKQDKTQWPGFEDNGSDILALPRNVGEVLGVFGVFEPKKDSSRHFGVAYLDDNSVNFDGLSKLEQ